MMLSEGIRAAIAAREAMGEDFFGGWEPSDLDLFAKYAFQSERVLDKITDWLGIKTSGDYLPHSAFWVGQVRSDAPIPNDGVHAEAIEYFAFLDAFSRARDSFTFIELGAGYAPWSCTAAVLCKRHGLKANITAVEASEFFYGLIPRHFEENGLSATDYRFMRGAVAPSNSAPLYFPKVSSAAQNGFSASPFLDSNSTPVNILSLDQIIGREIVDLLHIDIQGSEGDVLGSNLSLLQKQVKAVFVGTHNRTIDAALLCNFPRTGWKLIRERPSRYDSNGYLFRDGAQYWRNSLDCAAPECAAHDRPEATSKRSVRRALSRIVHFFG